MSSNIPVTFIDQQGLPSADNIKGAPCIRLKIANSHTGKSETVWACLDTGADHIYVDARVIERLELPVTAHVSANAAPTGVHSAHLTFIGGVAVTTTVVARTIRNHGNGFDVLLGRQVLNAGRLVYDLNGGNGCTFFL